MASHDQPWSAMLGHGPSWPVMAGPWLAIPCRLPGRNFLNRTFRPGTRMKTRPKHDREFVFLITTFRLGTGPAPGRFVLVPGRNVLVPGRNGLVPKTTKTSNLKKNKKRKFTNRVLERALDTKPGWIESFFVQESAQTTNLNQYIHSSRFAHPHQPVDSNTSVRD